MKYYIYSIFIFILFPLFTFGQTIVTNAEDYTIGDDIVFQECDTTGVQPPSVGGPWDYSWLTSLSTKLKIQILSDTGTKYGKLFPTADFVEKDSYGNYYFIKRDADANYIIGCYYSSSTSQFYADPLIDSYRKLSVGKTINDNFRDSSIYTKGGGTIEMSVIAKNTLTLPTGTYNNIILLKTTTYSADSQWNSQPLPSTISESYKWYDGIHPAPLLQLLFSKTGTDSYKTCMYLVSEKYTPIQEITQMRKITLYPNPAGNELNILAPAAGSLSIISNLGQVLQTIQLKENQTSVSLNEFPTGMYLVSFTSMGMVETQKIVISR